MPPTVLLLVLLIVASVSLLAVPLSLWVLLKWGPVGGTPRDLAARKMAMDERHLQMTEAKHKIEVELGQLQLRKQQIIQEEHERRVQEHSGPEGQQRRRLAMAASMVQPETGAVPPLQGQRGR